MANVAIIGAGAMGLAAAYHAQKGGHQVTIYEVDSLPGGAAAHFDFGGLSIERFYHFVCKADRSTFELLAELGIEDRMRWVTTSMGYFFHGRLYDWGGPIALLKFPELSLVGKLRYGLMLFFATRRVLAGELETKSAREWIESWCGSEIYDRLWHPLFDLKFYEYADRISAAWIWTRIKRVGTSRRSLMQEELGYIDGGTETLIRALVDAIHTGGGEIRLGSAVERVTTTAGRVTGVLVGGVHTVHDAVISTVPTPYVSRMIPDVPDDLQRTYDSIDNIAVVCVVLKLRRPVTCHFWVNISDSRIKIPGVVEFSNLRPTGATIVYIPYYMPVTHPHWQRGNREFIGESLGYLKLINSSLTDDDLIDAKVGRLKHAQPVCPPGFLATIPSVQTPIAGLQIADTCFYYPEDRGISESVRFGKLMAEAIDDPTVWKQA